MTIIPIREEVGQIAAANKIIAQQNDALSKSYLALTLVLKLNTIPLRVREQCKAAVKVIDGVES